VYDQGRRQAEESLMGTKFDAIRGAIISPCGLYRYRLTRRWSRAACVRTVNWIMLNPSTADAETDDATIRRCVNFARCWGYDEIVVTNLFALRSTDPRGLLEADDPVGPRNDSYLMAAALKADLVVCAWGEPPRALKARADTVLTALRSAEVPLRCLTRTASGQPGHPLRLRADLSPVPFGPVSGN
jgi:hypothetical protein